MITYRIIDAEGNQVKAGLKLNDALDMVESRINSGLAKDGEEVLTEWGDRKYFVMDDGTGELLLLRGW